MASRTDCFLPKSDEPGHAPYVALFITKTETEKLTASGYRKTTSYHLSESELYTTYYDQPHELSKLVASQSARDLFIRAPKNKVIEYLKRLVVADEVVQRIWVIYDFSRTTLPELTGGPNEMRGFVKGYLAAQGKTEDIEALVDESQRQHESWQLEYEIIRKKHPVILFERRSDNHGSHYTFVHPDLQPKTKKVSA